ncbi:hypothetical protein J3R30DRAFT_3776549 [Lentinula aciculospora]|uniref:RanBD1 domain-containing protein n=1 Tax=Lentinula aciculospora TaxID=153920 RepID=A0A9W9DL76_9AGAR|nr:hypothetical protein J3R30DRAFT_3776549 [Lentinula aciculospora]
MFPLLDYNLVYCGMATFAATVGYNGDTVFGLEDPIGPVTESKNLFSNNSLEGIDAMMVSAASPYEPMFTIPDPPLPAVVRGPSLKRKQMHDHDENNVPLEYPYNLAALYPNKRSKTPPSTSENAKSDERIPEPKEFEEKVCVEPDPAPENLIKPVGDSFEQPASKRQQRRPSPSVANPAPSSSDIEGVVAKTGSLASKNDIVQRSVSKAAPVSQTFAFESFATATPTPFSFNNGILASGASMRPVWSTTSSFRKRHSFLDKLEDDAADLEGGETHALRLVSPQDAPSYTQGNSKLIEQVDVTGEEDEDIQCELKGVKLFVKRGSNDYSGGILGQVKYLVDRKTSCQRLLFRREPLWQISMNARLQPTVRCTFDPQECILRLLLAESSASRAAEIIVYALKPGRFCSRKEFQTFAESVIGSSSLKTTETLRGNDEGLKDGTREAQS